MMDSKYTLFFRSLFLILSAIFIIIGIILNQHTVTMEKAIRICLECIGIG